MVCVSQQDFIELAQCVGRCVEQALASIDCAKPVVRQQASDFRLDFLLLGIKPPLPTFDTRHHVTDRDPQGATTR